MAKVKVNISIDEDLLSRLDCYADDNFLNRSSLVSIAVNQFLNAKDAVKAMSQISDSLSKIAATGTIDDNTRKDLDDFQRLCKMVSVN